MAKEDREGLKIHQHEGIPLSGRASPFIPHRKYKEMDREDERRGRNMKKVFVSLYI